MDWRGRSHLGFFSFLVNKVKTSIPENWPLRKSNTINRNISAGVLPQKQGQRVKEPSLSNGICNGLLLEMLQLYPQNSQLK